MTPHRSNQRGSYVLDRQFRGVGRLKRSSGTDDPALFKLLNTMLTMLYRGGRLDLLQAMRDGVVTPLEVWSRYRVGQLERLPSPDTLRGLRGALERWADTAEASRWHRQARTYAVRAVLRLARQDATVQDLPALLRSYSWAAKGPTMFNRTRAAMLAFLRDTLGRSHPVYQQCRDVRPRKEAKRAGSPLTVEAMTALTQQLTSAHAEIAWAMVLTGMGPGELWGRWQVLADRVHIAGTKRAGRARHVPLVRAIRRPARGYQAFRVALSEASGEAVEPYDLRRTYATWLEAAGIPRTRRRMYLGHGASSVTDLYERHQVDAFLAEDAERLRGVLGEVAAAGLRVVR
jgi:integrase